jgi:hypothetical protein
MGTCVSSKTNIHDETNREISQMMYQEHAKKYKIDEVLLLGCDSRTQFLKHMKYKYYLRS